MNGKFAWPSVAVYGGGTFQGRIQDLGARGGKLSGKGHAHPSKGVWGSAVSWGLGRLGFALTKRSTIILGSIVTL